MIIRKIIMLTKMRTNNLIKIGLKINNNKKK